MKKVISVFLALLFVLPCVCTNAAMADNTYKPDGLSAEYYAMMESGSADMSLGSLSAKYESNGNPATISSGADTGGVSYGAYQFSSRYGVPLDFANWCITGGEGAVTGSRLLAAYQLDGNKYGTTFNDTWRAIAAENSEAFLMLQHNYTKVSYYDVMVAKLETNVPGFKVSNYTLALQNVIWSRTVQQGKNTDVFTEAFKNLGGFANQSEDVLINAIYEQSSKLVFTPPAENSIMITVSSAEKYGIDPLLVAGRYMYYYSLNTSDIQVSVYRRLAVNEKQEALAMYEKYKGTQPTDPTDPVNPTDPAQPETPANGFEAFVQLFNMFIQFMIKLVNALISMAA